MFKVIICILLLLIWWEATNIVEVLKDFVEVLKDIVKLKGNDGQ